MNRYKRRQETSFRQKARVAVIGVIFFLILNLTPSGQSVSARGAVLEGFYIGAEVVSDASPFWFKYILDVAAESRGTMVRWIRVAPLTGFCSTPITVKATSAQLNDSVAELTGNTDLCSLTSQKVDRSLKRFRRTTSLEDTARFGIILRCGTVEKAVFLPYEQEIDLDRMKKNAPELSSLFYLYDDVVKRAFGEESVFHEISSQRDAELQALGQSLMPQLKAGSFDRGFRGSTLKDILTYYRGSVSEPKPIARLIVPSKAAFARYVDPGYPLLAKQARIEGTVELDLSLDAMTGKVRDVRVVTGHPLLTDNAMMAAKQWQFDTDADGFAEVFNARLDYTLDCPE